MANMAYQQYPQGPGFMEDAKNVLFKGFELLGTPDAYLRGLMVGSPGEKVWSGRDVLERWGAVGPDREGLDMGDIGGFALDVLNPLSPTNLLFGWTKALGKGAMAGAKGLGGVSKAAAAGNGAEALAQAKSLLGAAGGAAKAIAPGYAMAMGLPYAGAKLMAHGDERAPWKDALGMGLMTLPLALPLGMAAMRKGGFKKWSKKNVQEEITRLDAESGVPPQVPKEPWQMSPEEFLATFGVHATDSAASFKPESRLLEVTRPGQKRFFQGDAVVVRDALGRPIEGQGYNAALPGERASVVSSDPKVVSLYEQGHEALVRDAMARGLSIPDEVVSRYPQLQQARAALQPARRELDFLEQMGIRGVDEQQQVIQAARAQGIADLASDAGAQFVSGVAPPANPLSMRPGMTPQQELMERARAALGVANQGRSSGPSLMSLTPAAAGGTMLAMNENDDPTMNAIGTALLLGGLGLPLAMTAAKAGGKAGKRLEQAKQALQAPREGPFYSRLQEAILNAPEKFETRPEAVRVKPGRTITLPDGTKKVIPDKRVVTPGATAYDQMRSYLEGRAHPQEIEWVLGNQFADAPTITRGSLMDAFEKGRINLETIRHGGREVARPTVTRGQTEIAGPFKTREDAAMVAREIAENIGTPVVRRTDRGWMAGAKELRQEHGPLRFPDMLIPGGKNATEVPIRLGGAVKRDTLLARQNELNNKLAGMPDGPTRTRLELEAIDVHSKLSAGPRFPDAKGHFGDDIVAWTIHDQRTMPDGKTARFVQEIQSDWHQQGAKEGYAGALQPDKWTTKWNQQRSTWDVHDEQGRYLTFGWGDKSAEDALALARSNAGYFGVPNAPFKGNEWTKLGIKQALSDAIEAGDDYVLFAPPELVSRTQGMPIEKATKFYGEIVPNLANEMLKPYGVKLEKMPLPGTKVGKKEFIVSRTSYSEADLRYASPEQIDEIAKAAGWNPKQAMQHEVFGFRIPDTMKQTAKTKGFPLLQVGLPLAGAAGLGAYAMSQEGA